MQNNKNDFDITRFSDFSSIKGQYTNDFIKTQKCVVISNDKTIVKIAVSEKSISDISLLEKIHSPKKIQIIKVKDSNFAEFTGSFVDNIKLKAGIIRNTKSEFSLEQISSDAPVVNIINAICLEAIRRNSSDIHIQNLNDEVIVRQRIDGVLQKVKSFSSSVSPSLVNRIKIMSGLNVMENRLCQDGRMTVTSEGIDYDFRVSIVPCVKGQSIVLRLFNKNTSVMKLEDLGFTDKNLSMLKKAIQFPNGLILATGPTGSGKTTTLHALINQMDRAHLKIITIEDPVEKEIDGVDQIQVNNEIGLTFESILRRVLRQDPDVIMVGEIRDKETAELAIRAALTGHLILSTLHTNDSIGAITRLKNLGIEDYLIADVLRLSLAQRLLRKLCKNCNGSGCIECEETGYKGRTAISEVFTNNEKIKNIISKNYSEDELRNYLRKQGFKTLTEDALNKIRTGIISKEEMLREGLYEN